MGRSPSDVPCSDDSASLGITLIKLIFPPGIIKGVKKPLEGRLLEGWNSCCTDGGCWCFILATVELDEHRDGGISGLDHCLLANDPVRKEFGCTNNIAELLLLE